MNAGNQRLWYISRAGQAIGPMTDVELAWLAHEGHLERSDWIWAEGLARWIRVTDVRGLLPEPFARPMDVATPDRAFGPAAQSSAPVYGSAAQHRADPFAVSLAEQPSIETRMRQNMAQSPPNTEALGFQTPNVTRAAAVARTATSPRTVGSSPPTANPAPVAATGPAPTDRSTAGGWLGSVPSVRPALTEHAPTTAVAALSQLEPRTPLQAAPTAVAASSVATTTSQGTPASQWRAQLAVLVVNGVGKALDDLGVRNWNDLLDDTRLRALAEVLYGQLPFVMRVAINQVWGSGPCIDWLHGNLAALRSRVISDRRLSESGQPIKQQIESLLTEYLVAAAWPNEIEKRVQAALGNAQSGWSSVVGGLGTYVTPLAGVLGGGKSQGLPRLPAPGE